MVNLSEWSCSVWNPPPSSRNISTIAVFYALPVIQLVITYQTVRQPPCAFRRAFWRVAASS